MTSKVKLKIEDERQPYIQLEISSSENTYYKDYNELSEKICDWIEHLLNKYSDKV